MKISLIYLAEGILLGVATGPLCLLSCGPVYAPYLMQKQRTTVQSIMTLLQISAGRLLTYLIIGVSAGALGTHITDLKRPELTSLSYIIFSVVLIVSAFRTAKCDTGCSVAGWTRFAEIPFLLGMATGIGFCPSFILALTKAVDHGGMTAGALLFIAFFAGTSIYFIPLILFGIIGRTYRLRTFARIASLVVAVWFIGNGVLRFLR